MMLCSQNSYLRGLRDVLLPFTSLIMKMRIQYHELTKSDRSVRPEAPTICINGPSGIGKSLFMKPFCAEVLSQLLPEKDLPRLQNDLYSFVYSR